MVDHVPNRIQFGLVISVSGILFVVYVISSTTCIDFYPTRVLDVDDVQFPI